MLYVRMMFVMAVGIYMSRIVLAALGVVDYGIYNVVGGVVAMLSFFNSSMATATQRELNYEMGLGHQENLKQVFSVSFISYCLIAVAVVILAESAGMWFLLHKLVIPPDRLQVAIWVFQFSILTFVINMLAVPYNAAIIAHERMEAFAYISILEVVLKLLIAYLLLVSPVDTLAFYGALMCGNALIIRYVYSLYCRRHFAECRVRWIWDKEMFKRLFGFSGWILIGNMSLVFSTQGINMLINIFFGPILNASRAISVQVYNAINSFAANFIIATRPQVVKSYAQGEYAYACKLTFSTSKLSFILLFALALPVIMQTDYILELWLKTVPPYTALFIQLSLVDMLVFASFDPITSLARASGKIRNYQLIISINFLLTLVVSWILYRHGFPVYVAYVVSIVSNIIGLFGRVLELKHSQNFPAREYLWRISLPIVLSFLAVLLGSYVIRWCLPPTSNIAWLFLNTLIYLAFSSVLLWFTLLNQEEKALAKKMFYKIKKR